MKLLIEWLKRKVQWEEIDGLRAEMIRDDKREIDCVMYEGEV